MTNEELVISIQKGINCDQNIEALYMQNHKLIRKIALRYQNLAEVDDLIQEGFFGLLKAVERWDQDGGATFSGYASLWIKKSITQYINDHSSLIRIPTYARDRIVKYSKVFRDLRSKLNRDPTPQELASALDITLDQVDDIILDIITINPKSLHEIVDDSEDIALEDTIEDENNDIENLIDDIQAEELASILWNIVEDLKPKESEILKQRYQEGLTLQACGDKLGITRERVRQIEKKAIEKIRSPRYMNKITPYIESRSESMAYQSTGFKNFMHTWESVPERIVIFKDEVERRALQDVQKCSESMQ